jgi:hypothetical protein
MRGRTRRAALLLLVTCEGCNSNLAARYLSKTTAALRCGGWTEGTTPPTATLREHCEVAEERGPS